MSGDHRRGHHIDTTATTDDPLSFSASSSVAAAAAGAGGGASAPHQPMGGPAGTTYGLSSSPATQEGQGSHPHPNTRFRTNTNTNTSTNTAHGNRRAARAGGTAAGGAAGASPLARHGLVSDDDDGNGGRGGHRAGDLSHMHAQAAGTASAALSPPNLEHDPQQQQQSSIGIDGGGHKSSTSNAQIVRSHPHGGVTHIARSEAVPVGSDPLLDTLLGSGGGNGGNGGAGVGMGVGRMGGDKSSGDDANNPLASAMATPLFVPPQPQPQPQPSQSQAKAKAKAKAKAAHGSASLLDSSSLLEPSEPATASSGKSDQNQNNRLLFQELPTPSPIAQSSRLDFDSPSPVMIPRSEVKSRRKLRAEQSHAKVEKRGMQEEAEVVAAAAAAAPAAASQSDPLFQSPSPVMIPRSEMKRSNQESIIDVVDAVVVPSDLDHHHGHHSHHQRLMLRQASTDPLGGGSGGGGGSRSRAHPNNWEEEGNEETATATATAAAAAPPPLHASNPALARALWSSDDDAGGGHPTGHHPSDAAAAAAGNTIPASGSATVERQRKSSLCGEGRAADAAAVGAASSAMAGRDAVASRNHHDETLCRTARWRIRLGLLEVRPRASRGGSHRPGSIADALSGYVADGGKRRGSNGSGGGGGSSKPKRRGSNASTGWLDERTGAALNDVSSDDEDDDDPTKQGARRGTMQRSNSLGRLLGLGQAERTDEAGSRRSSFHHTWTSSDFAKDGSSSTVITSPRHKRRNSLSRLLGIGDDSDDEGGAHRNGDDHGTGTELQVNFGDVSSDEDDEPDPSPPLDTRPVICVTYAGSLDNVTMSQLVAQNVDMLKKQRLRYDGLAKRHYWNCKEIGSFHSASNGADEAGSRSQLDDDEDAGIASAAVVFDPLSALAEEAELKEKREQEMDLEYRREKARQHLGLPDKTSGNGNDKDGIARKRDSACGGSRFTEYYSSIEVAHVIEKDLNRLPPDHVAKYHRGRLKRLGMEVPNESFSYASTSASSGLSDDDDAVDEGAKLLRESRAERSKLLGEVLFVYAREHQTLGYRQGMHEVCSYLLLAMEIDLEEAEESTRAAEPQESTKLLDFEFLRNDLYCIFEAVMGRLSPAYDTHSTKGLPTTHSMDPSLSPMEVMGESILAKVRDVAGDAILYRTVTSLGVPPQLFCTRWVRLIFAREVEGSQNVLDLWDSFFAIAAEEEAAKRAEQSGDESITSDDEDIWHLASLSFMDVLEAAAASMILLVRERLLAGQCGTSGGGSSAAAMNDAMNVLMNYPPLKEATPLGDLVTTLIWQQRREARASAPPNRRGHTHLGGEAAPSGSTDRPKRRNSLSKLFGLDSEVGGGIADSVRGSMTMLSDALAVATTPTVSAHQSGDNAGIASTPQTHPPPQRRRSESSGAMRVAQPQAAVMTKAEPFDGRSNEELATSLGTSVATIMQHLKNTSLNDNITVPHGVWEALLDINNVGKDLMSREEE